MVNDFAFADKSAFGLVLARRALGDEAAFDPDKATALIITRNTQAYRHRITAQAIFL